MYKDVSSNASLPLLLLWSKQRIVTLGRVGPGSSELEDIVDTIRSRLTIRFVAEVEMLKNFLESSRKEYSSCTTGVDDFDVEDSSTASAGEIDQISQLRVSIFPIAI